MKNVLSYLSFAIATILLISFSSCKKVDNGCPTVSGLHTIRTAGTGATIGWTATIADSYYVVEYRKTGAATWTTSSSTSDSLAITGLATNTGYEYHVRSACSLSYSATATFTTAGCPEGYEGNDCTTAVRDKWIHAYNALDSKNGGAGAAYSTSISGPSIDPKTVSIARVTAYTGGFFIAPVSATVNGNNLTIMSQQPDNDGYFISGGGTLSGNTITISYAITGPDGSTPPVMVTDHYTGTWTY